MLMGYREKQLLEIVPDECWNALLAGARGYEMVKILQRKLPWASLTAAHDIYNAMLAALGIVLP